MLRPHLAPIIEGGAKQQSPNLSSQFEDGILHNRSLFCERDYISMVGKEVAYQPGPPTQL